MTREMIIEELVARGYKVTPQDTIKNGVSCRGILFSNGFKYFTSCLCAIFH